MTALNGALDAERDMTILKIAIFKHNVEAATNVAPWSSVDVPYERHDIWDGEDTP